MSATFRADSLVAIHTIASSCTNQTRDVRGLPSTRSVVSQPCCTLTSICQPGRYAESGPGSDERIRVGRERAGLARGQAGQEPSRVVLGVSGLGYREQSGQLPDADLCGTFCD